MQHGADWRPLLCRAKNEPYIASMGIYVLKASAIRDLLSKHFPEVCCLLNLLLGSSLW